MRYLGWSLGGLFLVDGLFSLLGKRDLIKMLNSSLGNKLPKPINKSLKKATNVNDSAFTAMGINNLIAGLGLLVVSTLSGLAGGEYYEETAAVELA